MPSSKCTGEEADTTDGAPIGGSGFLSAIGSNMGQLGGMGMAVGGFAVGQVAGAAGKMGGISRTVSGRLGRISIRGDSTDAAKAAAATAAKMVEEEKKAAESKAPLSPRAGDTGAKFNMTETVSIICEAKVHMTQALIEIAKLGVDIRVDKMLEYLNNAGRHTPGRGQVKVHYPEDEHGRPRSPSKPVLQRRSSFSGSPELGSKYNIAQIVPVVEDYEKDSTGAELVPAFPAFELIFQDSNDGLIYETEPHQLLGVLMELCMYEARIVLQRRDAIRVWGLRARRLMLTI